MIPFVKASAYGNDFLIVEKAAYSGDRHALTVQLCHRRKGIGADGVEWVSPGEPGEFDVRADLINADGSPAEISGNGTRCVAAYLAQQSPAKRHLRIATGAGVKTCEVTSVAGATFGFAMSMGRARQIEFREVLGREGVYVDLGNPHLVFIQDTLPEDWRSIAQSVQGLPEVFPQGVNLEFVTVFSPERLSAHFYERGAGETLSSGTGTCAAAVACQFAGISGTTVEVIAPGGAQTVVVSDSELTLVGTATLLCRGEAWL